MIKPGTLYTSIDGDTIPSLANRAYGDEKLWPRIQDANPVLLSDPKSDDPLSIEPGQSVIIPKIPELKRSKVKSVLQGVPDPVIEEENFPRNLMTVKVESQSPNISIGKVYTRIDAMVDAWEIDTPWNIGEDVELDRLTEPYVYPEARAYLGPYRIITGLLFDVSPSFSNAGRIKSLRGFSFAKNAVDSNMKEPLEYSDIRLDELIARVLTPFNINIYIGDGVDVGEPFDRITATERDTIFSFIARLAMQRGLLITSTRSGDIQIIKAASTGSVGVIEEGKSELVFGSGWAANFSGQARFHTYKAIGASPESSQKSFEIIDDGIPVSRYRTFRVDETTEGDIEKAAKWKRSKALADALTIPLPVNSWYAPDGTIWLKNTIVTVISKTLFVPNGFDFLIRGVEYSTSADGNTAVLSIVPPQVYTLEKIVEPWRSNES